MKKTFYIKGMHCKSCDILIRDCLDSIDGCNVISLSYKTWECRVDYDRDDIGPLQEAINKAGYEIWDEHTKDKHIDLTFSNLPEKIVRLAIVWAWLYILINSGITDIMPDYSKLSFGVAFTVGLVASISTCLAVTGGIIIWYNETVQTDNSFWTQVKFHTGRVLAFVLWWALLGMTWKTLGWSLWFNAIFSILIGIVLAYLWLQLFRILPNITKLWFHIPWWFSKSIFKLKDPKYAFGVWALTFLLPCGFTQSMQLFAMQSWDPLRGALIMWVFALGTLPVLFWLGMWTRYIKDKLTFINPLIASILIVFGVYTIYNGATILKAANDYAYVDPVVSSDGNILTENINRNYEWGWFSPYSLKLPSGKKYIINVIPKNDGLWCRYSVILPGKWEHYIKKDQPFSFEIDGSKPKTIKLVCWSMWMWQWEIVIN